MRALLAHRQGPWTPYGRGMELNCGKARGPSFGVHWASKMNSTSKMSGTRVLSGTLKMSGRRRMTRTPKMSGSPTMSGTP